ncbi:MAG: hypothetical protein QM589_03985 [Thermomicrobiales bacterium]
MERLRSAAVPIACVVCAVACFLVGVLLIPGAIESRSLTRAVLWLFTFGLVFVMLALVSAVRLQADPDATRAPVIWRMTTVLSWMAALPAAILAGAWALVAVMMDGLDSLDEASDTVFPQAIVAIVLFVLLPVFAPWRVPASASRPRRMLILLPMAAAIGFVWWLVAQ